MLKARKNEKGFTLIELVLVIIVLGILAAVAVPKFLDLKTAAEDARRQGLLAALRGTITLLHAQYLLDTTSTYNAASVADRTDIGGGIITGSGGSITYTWTGESPATCSYTDQGGFDPGTVTCP